MNLPEKLAHCIVSRPSVCCSGSASTLRWEGRENTKEDGRGVTRAISFHLGCWEIASFVSMRLHKTGGQVIENGILEMVPSRTACLERALLRCSPAGISLAAEQKLHRRRKSGICPHSVVQ